MTPNEEIKAFIKEMKAFKKNTLEEADIDHFDVIPLLQLIEASKQIIRTSESIIAEKDNK